MKHTFQPRSPSTRIRFTIRTEPESWSGVGTHASTISTRPFARCSRAMAIGVPGAGWRASASFHRSTNLAWFTTWNRLVPLPVSVPEVTPSKCTTAAAGW